MRREASGTAANYYDIYFKRKTSMSSFNAYNSLVVTWSCCSSGNVVGTDFDIYSTLEDAIAGTNAWTSCTSGSANVGFPGRCGPSGTTDGS